MRDRKEYMRAYQREWIKKRRNAWISENGPCAKCGSIEQLEVDHIDYSQKKLHPRELWTRQTQIRTAELAKCQVLCRKCHRQKTKADLSKMNQGLMRPKSRKLTKKQVFEILKKYHIDCLPRSAIANELGFNRGRLWNIVSGRDCKDWFDEFLETMGSGRLARRVTVNNEDAGAEPASPAIFHNIDVMHNKQIP